MSTYYAKCDDRPKVFGMTCLPALERVDISTAISKMEVALFSTAIIVNEATPNAYPPSNEDSLIQGDIEYEHDDKIVDGQYFIGLPKTFKEGWEKRLGWLVIIEIEEEHSLPRILDFGLLVPAQLMDDIERCSATSSFSGVKSPRSFYDASALFEALGQDLVSTAFTSVADFYHQKLKVTEDIEEDQYLLRAVPIPHFPITYSRIVQSVLFLPLIIRAINFAVLTTELRASIGLEAFISPPLMMEAMSSCGGMTGRDYERLEFLGDSFLKLQLSLDLFCKHPTKNEGWLTASRQLLEQNSNLEHAGVKLGFPSSSSTQTISKKTWFPPDYKLRQTQHVSNKAIADTVEAVIGGCFAMSGSYGGGLAVRQLLGLKDIQQDWREYSKMMRKNDGALEEFLSVAEREEVNLRLHLHKQVEEMFGYTFKDPFLLCEALTHPSARKSGSADSSQSTSLAAQITTFSDLLESRLETLRQKVSTPKTGVEDTEPKQRDGSHNLSSTSRKRKASDVSYSGRRNKEGFFWLGLDGCPKILESAIRRTLVDPFWPYFLETGIEEIVRNDAMITEDDAMNKHDIGIDLLRMMRLVGCKDVVMKCEEAANSKVWECTITKHGVLLGKQTDSSKKRARREAIKMSLPLLEKYTTKKDDRCECIIVINEDESDDSVNGEVESVAAPMNDGEIYGRMSMVGIFEDEVAAEIKEKVLGRTIARDEKREKSRRCSNDAMEMGVFEFSIQELVLEIAAMEIVSPLDNSVLSDADVEAARDGLMYDDGVFNASAKTTDGRVDERERVAVNARANRFSVAGYYSSGPLKLYG
ncbi:hypothetical protein BC829DRAFT_421910 [Chytridium lagenaria]|nr:hypothetical protein BC829DRAFT_421910 [Chytridium lagenaria]